MKQTEKIVKGLALIMKYSPDSVLVTADDQLWCGAGVKMNNVDVQRMKDWGWFEDEESWSHYVDD
jgi:hypothetical protein